MEKQALIDASDSCVTFFVPNENKGKSQLFIDKAREYNNNVAQDDYLGHACECTDNGATAWSVAYCGEYSDDHIFAISAIFKEVFKEEFDAQEADPDYEFNRTLAEIFGQQLPEMKACRCPFSFK